MKKKGLESGPRKGEQPDCKQFKDIAQQGYINLCGETTYSCERAQKEGLCTRNKKTVILTEKEWVAVMDILCRSRDRRAGIIYQKVGTQVIL